MRSSSRSVNDILSYRIKRTFAQAVADLKDPKKVEEFFEDFFTEKEYDNFAKRMAIAYWLKKDRSYENIMENLKVSSATIASVQKMMQNPGFKEALKNIEAEEWASIWSERIKQFIK